MIRFQCPGCQATYTVGDEKAGKQGKCPKCQSAFVIPGVEASSAPPAPPPPPAPEDDGVEIAPCPKCGTRLTVSPGDIGLNVQCPSCATTFQAARIGESAPTSALSSRGEPEDERPSRRRRDSEWDDDRPSRRRRDDDDDWDDSSRRRPMRQSEARSRVGGPALALIIIASLSLCLMLFGIAIDVLLLAGILRIPPNEMPKVMFRLVWAVILLATNSIVLFGAVQMKGTKSYSLAMTACILSVIPCLSPCIIFGIPFGIWGIVALNGQGVRRAFN